MIYTVEAIENPKQPDFDDEISLGDPDFVVKNEAGETIYSLFGTTTRANENFYYVSNSSGEFVIGDVFQGDFEEAFLDDIYPIDPDATLVGWAA